MYSKFPVAHNGMYVTGIFADKRMIQKPYWLLTIVKLSSVKHSRLCVAQMHTVSVLNFMNRTDIWVRTAEIRLTRLTPLLILPFVSMSSQTVSVTIMPTRNFVHYTAIHIFLPLRCHTHYTYVTLFTLLVSMLRIWLSSSTVMISCSSSSNDSIYSINSND